MSNKKQLIKLQDKFILVSDDAINVNAFYLQDNSIIKCVEENVGLANMCYPKIIAGIPELPSIDFSLLNEEDCKTIGWVDVEKLAKEKFPNSTYGESVENIRERKAFIKGFKTAQSLNDKMFSLEDIQIIVKQTLEDAEKSVFWNKEYHKHLSKSIIQSLQQTIWEVEAKGNKIIKIINK